MSMVISHLVDPGCVAKLLLPLGRSLGVVPRKEAPEGYMDLDHDDYKEGDVFKDWQQIVLDTAHIVAVNSPKLVIW